MLINFADLCLNVVFKLSFKTYSEIKFYFSKMHLAALIFGK
jgi:hypothetical protein